jgi:methyltransferase OMS1
VRIHSFVAFALSHLIKKSIIHTCCDTVSILDDTKIEWDETMNGMLLLRRFLLRHAHGDVLEIAGGSGRNLSYYPVNDVRSVTITDTSAAMLNTAVAKAVQLDLSVVIDPSDTRRITSSSTPPSASLTSTPFTFETGDGQSMRYADAQFDTVVDTFGLCSFSRPRAVLREVSRVLRPGGCALLLEHGRTRQWPSITNLLDSSAESHAQEWGCWWNRDVQLIVEDVAAETGLVVESKRLWHLGTTSVWILRKPLVSAR